MPFDHKHLRLQTESLWGELSALNREIAAYTFPRAQKLKVYVRLKLGEVEMLGIIADSEDMRMDTFKQEKVEATCRQLRRDCTVARRRWRQLLSAYADALKTA